MLTPTTPDRISDVDRDAFERALAAMLMHREAIYRREFKRRLDEGEPRDEIGRDAAKTLQGESLGIAPWQTPPWDAKINETDAPGWEHRKTRVASLTLERLLAAGLSRYEPDPIGALARVERAAWKKKRPAEDEAARARRLETQRVWSPTDRGHRP